MKNIIKTLLVGSLAAVSLTSCQRDLTSLNVNPKKPSSLPSENLLATGLYYSSTYMYTPNVNYNNYRFFTQQLAEVTYIDESNYDLVTRSQPRNHFNLMYVYGINNIKTAKQSLAEENNSAEVTANKLATLEIQEIFIWENLVNTFGNIPYSEAFSPDKTLTPKYDDAAAIYTDLLKRIDAVIATINTSAKGYTTGDLVYYGDMSKWKKFANSIKLRLAINLADVDATTSKAKAEEAIQSGVISSNSDSYAFTFDGGTFLNPVYSDFVASGRNDFVPSSVVIDLMNASSDPRREIWFTTVGGQYVGGKFGSLNPYANFSHYKSVLTSATGSANLLSFTEVKFLLAEAAARGYNTGSTAETLYKEAITASMQEWGVASSDIATYLTNNPYNASNWKKSIGEQAYISLFDRGYASWNFTRRLDYPVLTNPDNSQLETIPYRMPYSHQEYTLNGTNVKAAATAIGGDKAETKLFWDKN